MPLIILADRELLIILLVGLGVCVTEVFLKIYENPLKFDSKLNSYDI